MYDIISYLIEKLKDIGLIVSVFISDLGSNNIKLKNQLKVMPQQPYFL